MLAAKQSTSVFPLAAPSLLAEKPRLGHQLPTAVLHPGFGFAISNTATGLNVSAYDFRRRSRCSAKERDAETGLDFFGARYYSSAQGRFTSPDWSAIPEAIPYASLDDPQTLNLYSYVRNNPLRSVDPDGHCCFEVVRIGLDGARGFLKGAANHVLDGYAYEAQHGDSIQRVVGGLLQTDFRFTPSNASEAVGMQLGERHGDTALTIGMAVVGGAKSEGGALPNEAVVVRGGIKVSETAVGTHESGVTGVSVESAPGKSAGQLSSESPIVSRYPQVRCCTVGDVRAAGGDVVPTKGASPNHATLTGLPPAKINEVLKPPVPNPAKQPPQQ